MKSIKRENRTKNHSIDNSLEMSMEEMKYSQVMQEEMITKVNFTGNSVNSDV
jgi:hypothetical protein